MRGDVRHHLAVILHSLIPIFIPQNSARDNPTTLQNPQHLDLLPGLPGTLPLPPFPFDVPPGELLGKWRVEYSEMKLEMNGGVGECDDVTEPFEGTRPCLYCHQRKPLPSTSQPEIRNTHKHALVLVSTTESLSGLRCARDGAEVSLN